MCVNGDKIVIWQPDQSVAQIAGTLRGFHQSGRVGIFKDDERPPRQPLRRAIWYVRVVLGFTLVFARLGGLYARFGAWGVLDTFASIVAERMPRRW